jgi:hypothetical protein
MVPASPIPLTVAIALRVSERGRECYLCFGHERDDGHEGENQV